MEWKNAIYIGGIFIVLFLFIYIYATYITNLYTVENLLVKKTLLDKVCLELYGSNWIYLEHNSTSLKCIELSGGPRLSIMITRVEQNETINDTFNRIKNESRN